MRAAVIGAAAIPSVRDRLQERAKIFGQWLGMDSPIEDADATASVTAATGPPTIDCSTRTLQKRAALLSSTNAQELADLARDGYQKAAAGLENPCYEH